MRCREYVEGELVVVPATKTTPLKYDLKLDGEIDLRLPFLTAFLMSTRAAAIARDARAVLMNIPADARYELAMSGDGITVEGQRKFVDSGRPQEHPFFASSWVDDAVAAPELKMDGAQSVRNHVHKGPWDSSTLAVLTLASLVASPRCCCCMLQ